jgi:hypothetical protein
MLVILGVEDIKVVENFVNPQKAKELIDFLDSCGKPTKFKETRFSRHIDDKKVREIIEEIRDSTMEIINEYFFERGLKIVKLRREHNTQLVRFSGEESLPSHVDMERKSKWTPDISAIAYLNDNYGGGEIVFGDAKIEIKPKAYSLIIFPSGMPHETKRNYPIDNLEYNYRCSVPMFFTFKVEELWK